MEEDRNISRKMAEHIGVSFGTRDKIEQQRVRCARPRQGWCHDAGLQKSAAWKGGISMLQLSPELQYR
jgi:hypothetical protein